MTRPAQNILAAGRAVRGLYAVTPDESDTTRLAALVRAAISGGASLVQYRNKGTDTLKRHEQAAALLVVCRTHGVPLIINDDLSLALAIDADGVHFGADDGSIEAARAQLEPHKILGVSCYNSLPTAHATERIGVTYVAFGSFFPSTVKPGAVSAPLRLLRDAKASLAIPVAAIGGITTANAGKLIAAGGDCVAVISALFTAVDVEVAARQFAGLFPSER